MKETYYKKVGRRYVPISEYNSEWADSYPEGAALIVCKPGSTSRKFNINPAFAPMIAAATYAEDKMCAAIVAASEARPSQQPLTPEQQAAWAAMRQAFGSELTYIQYPSAHDAVRAGLEAMQAEADRLLAHPAVKTAYDQFLLICQLAANEKTDAR